jgi:uncharacterized cupin superfamily protein
MLQRLSIPNIHVWSELRPDLGLIENGYLLVAQTGNVAIDPLPLDRGTREEIERLGGISRIVVMSAERREPAQQLSTQFGSKLVSDATHREPLFEGAIAVALRDQRRGGEFAVSLPSLRIVIAGDALVGSPAGALSMHADAEYRDARRAALGLRRILRENPETLLLAHGQSIFTDAYATLYRLLLTRAGGEIHRINVDELDFRNERAERENQPSVYHCMDAEVGFVIGARQLGYRVSTLEPGQRFCPLHSHAREEELFFVLEGEPSVRMSSGTIRCRKGDFIALPVGETGTHQLINESDAPATVLLLARTEEVEACYYPDSDKLLVDTPVALRDAQNSIMVRATPQLDYFDGES